MGPMWQAGRTMASGASPSFNSLETHQRNEKKDTGLVPKVFVHSFPFPFDFFEFPRGCHVDQLVDIWCFRGGGGQSHLIRGVVIFLVSPLQSKLFMGARARLLGWC
jgi:hypothetical protein